MNPVVFHIASGDSFFSGIGLLLTSFALARSSRQLINRLTGVTFIAGIVAIAASSTAIPYWIYGIAGVTTGVWIASRYVPSWQERASFVATAVWLSATAIELPWQIGPTIDPVSGRSMTVIGDSVTAGLGTDETAERWTEILERNRNIQVQDLSHVGETAASALKRASNETITHPLVVVEIGGNDILGVAPSSTKFANDLDALLNHVTSHDRQVVMFELPLPPFHHEYNRIQRNLATRYRVKLIPRRRFLSVLAAGDATLDSIHLSEKGHRMMADCVWRVLQSAFDSETP